MRGDIDHPAPATVDHARQQRRHQRDGGQHIGIERTDEIIAPPIRPETGGRTTGIGDQNIDRTRRIEHAGAIIGIGDIRGDRRDADAVTIADLLGGLVQRLGTACVENQIDTRLGQGFGATTPQTLRRCAHKRALSCNP